VPVVDPVVGAVVTQPVQQVADVVQQGGGDVGGRCPGVGGQGGGLQAVFQLGDGFPAVQGVPAGGEQVGQAVEELGVGHGEGMVNGSGGGTSPPPLGSHRFHPPAQAPTKMPLL
jgi:hypothetical protein